MAEFLNNVTMDSKDYTYYQIVQDNPLSTLKLSKILKDNKEVLSKNGSGIFSKVTYHVNSTTVYQENVEAGKSVLNPTSFPTPTKEGYIFLGWNTDSEAEDALTTLKADGNDIVLYAIMTANTLTVLTASLSTGSDSDCHYTTSVLNTKYVSGTTLANTDKLWYTTGESASAIYTVSLGIYSKAVISYKVISFGDSAKEATKLYRVDGNNVTSSGSITATAGGTHNLYASFSATDQLWNAGVAIGITSIVLYK